MAKYPPAVTRILASIRALPDKQHRLLWEAIKQSKLMERDGCDILSVAGVQAYVQQATHLVREMAGEVSKQVETNRVRRPSPKNDKWNYIHELRGSITDWTEIFNTALRHEPAWFRTYPTNPDERKRAIDSLRDWYSRRLKKPIF